MVSSIIFTGSNYRWTGWERYRKSNIQKSQDPLFKSSYIYVRV